MNKIKIDESWNLNEAIQNSMQEPILLFKHSTSCGISHMALKNFESDLEGIDSTYKYYFLDLITYRSISNEIADTLDVRHESPQLIVIKDGKVTHHASHHSISIKEVELT